jgi:hypothetical protein
MLCDMKALGFASLCCAALALAAVDDAAAGGRSGGARGSFSGHAGSTGHFTGHAGAFRGSHFHSHSRIFIGGTFVAAPLFFYPPPYYYAPVPAYYYPAPPAYMEQAPTYIQQAPAAQPQSQQYWYFCAASQAYYPYARECPGGWQRVLPSPQSPPAG